MALCIEAQSNSNIKSLQRFWPISWNCPNRPSLSESPSRLLLFFSISQHNAPRTKSNSVKWPVTLRLPAPACSGLFSWQHFRMVMDYKFSLKLSRMPGLIYQWAICYLVAYNLIWERYSWGAPSKNICCWRLRRVATPFAQNRSRKPFICDGATLSPCLQLQRYSYPPIKSISNLPRLRMHVFHEIQARKADHV